MFNCEPIEMAGFCLRQSGVFESKRIKVDGENSFPEHLHTKIFFTFHSFVYDSHLGKLDLKSTFIRMVSFNQMKYVLPSTFFYLYSVRQYFAIDSFVCTRTLNTTVYSGFTMRIRIAGMRTLQK